MLYYFYVKFVLKTNIVNHCKQTLYIIILPLGYCLNDWKSYYNFYKHTTQIHTLFAYKFDLKIRPSSLKKLYQSFKLHFEEQVLNSHNND